MRSYPGNSGSRRVIRTHVYVLGDEAGEAGAVASEPEVFSLLRYDWSSLVMVLIRRYHPAARAGHHAGTAGSADKIRGEHPLV